MTGICENLFWLDGALSECYVTSIQLRSNRASSLLQLQTKTSAVLQQPASNRLSVIQQDSLKPNILQIIHVDFSASYICLTTVTTTTKLSLDAEKASDHLTWTFVLKTLEKHGRRLSDGSKHYDKPKAAVVTNTSISTNSQRCYTRKKTLCLHLKLKHPYGLTPTSLQMENTSHTSVTCLITIISTAH